MRRLAALGLAAALAGCFSETHTASTHFDLPGAFKAMLGEGARVRGPHLSYGERPIPLSAPDLEEAWGERHYELVKLRWEVWVRSGPTSMNPHQQYELLGFELDAAGLAVHSGYSPRGIVREPALHFLENATRLPAAQREAVAERLAGGNETVALDGGDLDATGAWRQAGGLGKARKPEGTGYTLQSPALVYDGWPGSLWQFKFAYATATLDERGPFAEGGMLWATPDGRVGFVWHTDGRTSDEAAYGKLQDQMEDAGLEAPQPWTLQWSHGMSED